MHDKFFLISFKFFTQLPPSALNFISFLENRSYFVERQLRENNFHKAIFTMYESICMELDKR